MESENNVVIGQTQWVVLNSLVIPEDAQYHSPEEVTATAQSLKKIGQLHEAVVCPLGDGRYEVRAGVCRVLAARQLVWEKIRCNIRPAASEYEKRMITFVENEERHDASPLYQAQLLNAMMKDKNLDQKGLAEEVGKTEAWVSQYLSLLTFSPEVQKNLTRVKLGMKQLLEIRKLDGDEAQMKAAEEVQGLTKEQTKAAVKKHLAAQGKTPKAKKAKPPLADLAWKGEEIVINRHYKPAEESAEDFIAWLTQALPAFAESKPLTEPSAVPAQTPAA